MLLDLDAKKTSWQLHKDKWLNTHFQLSGRNGTYICWKSEKMQVWEYPHQDSQTGRMWTFKLRETPKPLQFNPEQFFLLHTFTLLSTYLRVLFWPKIT